MKQFNAEILLQKCQTKYKLPHKLDIRIWNNFIDLYTLPELLMMKYFYKLFNYYHFSMRVPYVLKPKLPGQFPYGYPSQTRQLYNVIEILVNILTA